MTKFRKDLVLPLGFMIAAAIVLVGHEATAKRSNYAAPATHVATVDLSKLFDRIHVRPQLQTDTAHMKCAQA